MPMSSVRLFSLIDLFTCLWDQPGERRRVEGQLLFVPHMAIRQKALVSGLGWLNFQLSHLVAM